MKLASKLYTNFIIDMRGDYVKKKTFIISAIVIVALIALWLFTSYTDSARVRNGVEPKWVIKTVSEDGCKVTYWGLGYKVIRYPRVSPEESYKNNRGVRYGNWFIKYELPDEKNKWGVLLETENVTPSGLTILCTQSGESDYELSTGSYYVIQRLDKNGWEDVEFIPQEYDVGWTMEAWIIEKDATTQWEVNWEWLYGKLPAGEYRIGKEIMSFIAPGDYDKEMIYAEFMVK